MRRTVEGDTGGRQAMEPTEVLRALAATTSDALELGLSVEDASVIWNSDRLAARLVPCDVLARVAAPVRRNHEFSAFEVEMARQLEGADCPIGVVESRVRVVALVR